MSNTNNNYPTADISKAKHGHLDFLNITRGALSMLGGMVNMNQTGTEYAFYPMDEYIDHINTTKEIENIVNDIVKAKTPDFELAKKALEMSEIFRVDEEMFDPLGDREQEILNGYIRHCINYNHFRSFAWTLNGYCEENKKQPNELSYSELKGMCSFISAIGSVYYEGESYSPVICSGEDLHVYYLPDTIPADKIDKFINFLNDGIENEAGMSCVASIQGLRKELEYMYPAVQTIYNELFNERDTEEVLEGPTADVLYVWCSMAYAARRCFYSEDGPMNCIWDYPQGKTMKKRKPAKKEVQEENFSYFTYNQGLKVKGTGFTMDIPDGFVIEEKAEDRDFIAYIPNEDAPGDYMESEFVIYAGQKMEQEVIKQFRIPMEYGALVTGMSSMLGAVSTGGVAVEKYKRSDLPGGIFFLIDDIECIHANGIFAVGNCMQMMRVMALGKYAKNEELCKKTVASLFDRMHADTKPEMLKPLDISDYITMDLTGKTHKEWIKTTEEYVAHLSVARNLTQNYLVENFQSGQGGSIAKLKKQLKDMLGDISSETEIILKQAFGIYVLKCLEYPTNGELDKMKKAIENLAEFATQFVNIDNTKLEVKSDYATAVKKMLKNDLKDIAKEILSKSEKSNPELENALKNALNEYSEKERLAQEEKKRAEAEKKAREAEVKKAQEEKRIAEEKAKAIKEAEEQKHRKEAIQKAKELRKRYEYASGLIACSMYHAVAVKPDGTVIATGKNNDGQCNVSSWRNIIAVDCDPQGTVGLCADGTVRYTGSTFHKQYQCTQWRDIKAIAICNNCIFGLKNNGTVVATTEGVNGARFSTKPDVTSWHNIIAIRAGENNVLGIKENGSTIAISRNYYGRCEEDYYLDGKKDVVDADYGNLAGGVWLTQNGSCEAAGGQYSGIKHPKLINQHIGIVKVGIFGTKPFALLSDGRVVFEPSVINKDGWAEKDEVDEFIKREKIEKAIAVKSNSNYSAIVLTEDGRVIVLSRGGYGIIDSGECFGKGFRLFKDFHQMMDEKELAEEKARKAAEEELKRRETLQEKGLCQHCGGEFKKGLFGVKCVQCKKRKDY